MVYVDPLFDTTARGIRPKGSKWRYPKACHLFVQRMEDVDALHELANRIGLRRAWYQGPPTTTLPHYDLTEAMRRKAISAGAVALDQAAANAKMRTFFERKHLEAFDEGAANG